VSSRPVFEPGVGWRPAGEGDGRVDGVLADAESASMEELEAASDILDRVRKEGQ